jgi:uncharacterized protein YigA (DUF484 family)
LLIAQDFLRQHLVFFLEHARELRIISLREKKRGIVERRERDSPPQGEH